MDAIVVREEEEAHELFSFLCLGKNRSGWSLEYF
jgi:hypothetical protein